MLLACSMAVADDAPLSIPAGTHVFFHVGSTLSSNTSRTGEAFRFNLARPIDVPGVSIPVEGTSGAGTVYLAGRAGTSGHEGDLTLRLDSLRTADGRTVTFENEQLQINGRNRKIASGVLGFIPYVGVASIFIRGSETRVDPSVSVENILGLPALVAPAISVASCAPHGTCDAKGFTVSVVTAGADEHGPILRFTMTNDTDAPIDFAETASSAAVDQSSLVDVASGDPPRRLTNRCPAADTSSLSATELKAEPVPKDDTIAPHASLTIVAAGLLCAYDMKTGRAYKGSGSMGGPVLEQGHDTGNRISIPTRFEITP